MSSMTSKQLRALVVEFNMAGGYVLNLTSTQFIDIFDKLFEHIDITDPKYATTGTSKAKLLKEFIRLESDEDVALALEALRAHTKYL